MHLTNRDGHGGDTDAVRARLPRRWALAAVGLSLLLVFWLDRATDAAPVQHLYYAPIILAAIAFGYRGGLSAGWTAVALYHLANPAVVPSRYQAADILQIAVFIAVGLVAAKLTSDARRLRHLAMTDDLTGLHNLRSFEARLQSLARAAAARGRPLSLLVLDVDRLKALNDEHGHLAGAEAVQAVGRIIGARIPAGAVACRYGGDEFVVALPGCGEDDALRVADALRRSVHEAALTLAGRAFTPGTLSISIGVASRSFDGNRGNDLLAGDSLFRAADAALYTAKGSGRNRAAAGAA
jgi:diguanylate cyclase (GGDEF)-like protein